MRILLATLLLVLAVSPARAQEIDAAGGEGWSFSLSATGYLMPDDDDYVQPTFSADRGMLHLEARHAYEDQDTTSLWGGVNLSFGETTTVDVTPMLGAVAGNTDGVAPGFELTVARGRFELYSEAEYVFASGGASEDFFYAWTEATWSPVEWFRFGLAGQRTRAHDSDVEVERGLALGFTVHDLDISTYVMDAGLDEPIVMLGLAWSF